MGKFKKKFKKGSGTVAGTARRVLRTTVPDPFLNPCENLFGLLATGLVAAVILAIGLFAPTEETMGHAQRIVYAHVSVAWFSLVSFLVMAGTGVVYLVGRSLVWDQWSQASAELGWLCSTLTLFTGSLWAHEAWGIWWTWDPRLTTAFILWTIYSGYLIVRASLEDPHRRARMAAVLAIIGILDVPLVILATRWLRGVHPVSPGMEPSMRLVLLLSLMGFSAFFSLLIVRRRGQLHLEGLLVSMEQKVDVESARPATADDAVRFRTDSRSP